VNYWLHLSIMICIYVALAQSLNLIVGYGGMLSLCHAAFCGIGAYASTILMMRAHWPFEAAVVAAVAGVSLIAWLVSFLITRLHGDFFVLGTLGFQQIVYAILYNWVDVTQGQYGIPGVPRPSLFGVRVVTPGGFLILALAVSVLCGGIAWWLTASAYGRLLQAVREDPVAAQSLGKDANAIKRSAFAWAGGLAALPGVVYATYSSYIDPTSFGLEDSILILTMLVVGGAGNFRGPVVGAVILVLLPELLRFLAVPDRVAPNLRQIVYGVAIVVMMRFRPQGIAGKYAFD